MLSIVKIENMSLTGFFKFLILGVRSLANASRARQLKPPKHPWGGVGWVPLPQTNMAAVVGRARSVMRARSCVRGRSWSCAVGRAWSCAVGRAWSVICGRARSVVPCCPLRGQHCRGTNERTTSNNPLNPPGVGWGGSIFFIFLR